MLSFVFLYKRWRISCGQGKNLGLRYIQVESFNTSLRRRTDLTNRLWPYWNYLTFRLKAWHRFCNFTLWRNKIQCNFFPFLFRFISSFVLFLGNRVRIILRYVRYYIKPESIFILNSQQGYQYYFFCFQNRQIFITYPMYYLFDERTMNFTGFGSTPNVRLKFIFAGK